MPPIIACADIASLGLLVLGHVLYGLPRTDAGRRTVTLHNGDDFSAADEPPRPERLVGVRAVNANAVTPLAVESDHVAGVTVDVSRVELPAWLVAETMPAFIELPPDSFNRYLAHEGLDAVIASRGGAGATLPGREIYSKHIKVALGTRGGRRLVCPGPVGLPVAFQPDMPIEIGRTLTVRAFVDGAPRGGLQVRVHHKARAADVPRDVLCARTDEAGCVSVAIDAEGYWRLHAIDMQPLDEGEAADWRSRWACLVFEV